MARKPKTSGLDSGVIEEAGLDGESETGAEEGGIDSRESGTVTGTIPGTGDIAGGAPRKPRPQRKSGSVSFRGKKTGKQQKVSLDLTAEHIQGFHQIAALATGIQELVIGEEEAKNLSDAIKAVSAQYDVLISGKSAAWMNLALIAAMVYVPRLMVGTMRIRQEKEEMNAREGRPIQPPNLQPDEKTLSESEKEEIRLSMELRQSAMLDQGAVE